VVKQNATLDSSFWIHSVAAGLVDYLLDDFELHVALEVANELTEGYPSGARLHTLIRAGEIRIAGPAMAIVTRFGPGERAAINLEAQNKGWILLMDDRRPFIAAEGLGLAPVASPVYAASLYRRGVLEESAVLGILARLSARSTVSPQLIDLALVQTAVTEEDRK